MDILEIDLIVTDIVRRVSDVIDGVFDLEIENKGAYTDLVTRADKEVEAFISQKLRENFPDAQILGEETWDENKEYSTDKLFVIDPIDGTTNFVKQKKDYCTIVTYFEDGKAQLSYIYDIVGDVLYSLIRDKGFFIDGLLQDPPENLGLKDSIASLDLKRLWGQEIVEEILKGCFAPRILGSAGLEGVRIARGQIGVYVNKYAGPWDFSAYYLMAKELGLHLSDLNGNPLDPTKKSNFIISTKAIAKDLGLD